MIAAINKFLDWVIDVLKFVLDLIEGILAPFFFYGWAGNWRGFLKQGATDAQAIMNGLPIAKSGDPLWKGPGADAYKAKVPAQVAAAQALADVCDSAGSVCMDLATAGVLLYFAVASLILGTDPVRQQAPSPTSHAAAPNAPAFLLPHVQRPDGIAQADELAAALQAVGTSVEEASFPGTGLAGHAEINRRLGDPTYAETPVVDAWLARVFA